MKKLALLAAITASTIMITGCSSDSDGGVNGSDGSISLRGITQKLVATEITASNFNDFLIYGYTNTSHTVSDSDVPSFMYDVLVNRVYDNNEYSWTYAPVKYWPTNNTNVHFYAFAPASSVGKFAPEAGTAGLPRIVYSVPEDVHNQEDLIWANAEGLNRDTNGESAVPMAFHHAMSEVIFMAESAYESVVHNVTRIEFFGLKGDGEFDLVNGVWNVPDGTRYNYYAINLMDSNGNGIDVSYNNLSVLTSSDEGNAMMILPQVTTVGDEFSNYDATSFNPNDGKAYIRVTFGSRDAESGQELVPQGYTYIAPFRWTDTDTAVTLDQGIRYIVYLTLTGTTNGGEAEDGQAPEEPGLGQLLTISFDAHVNDFTTWVTIPITM